MQEPARYNLLSVLQKGFKSAQKKIYLHRIIYILSYIATDSTNSQDERVFNILFDSNIKLINEEYDEECITGFGLFYAGYIINIIEGPEEILVKHLKTLLDAFDQQLNELPEVNRMKILLVSNHINKRYFTAWNGRLASPPVLVLKMEPTQDPEINARHVQNCILKLYRMSDYLRNKPANLLSATMDNISDLCQANLPESVLLDFLLDSPALMDLRDYIKVFGCIPEYSLYHQNIWPITFDFVPYNILEEVNTKKLMSSTEIPVESVSQFVHPRDDEEEAIDF